MTELAYEGVTVVDMSQGVAGPYCAAMLGLHGATAIKVEPPDGDWIRLMGGGQDGMTALAIVSNLGKRSICLDAKKPEGRALVEKLASKADVLVENFRPGVMQKLGLDYAAARRGQSAARVSLDHRLRRFGPVGGEGRHRLRPAGVHRHGHAQQGGQRPAEAPRHAGPRHDRRALRRAMRRRGAVRAHPHRSRPADQGLARRMLRGLPGRADRRRSAVRRPLQAADRRALGRVRDRGRVHRAAHLAHRHVGAVLPGDRPRRVGERIRAMRPTKAAASTPRRSTAWWAKSCRRGPAGRGSRCSRPPTCCAPRSRPTRSSATIPR